MDEAFSVRIVRADEEAIIAGELHHQGEHPLFGIGAHPDVACEIFGR
jgi:hypothetical protein